MPLFNPYTQPNPYTPAPQYQAPQTTNGINWVQGIEGAKAWQLAPNSNVVLLDSENDGMFYIKVSDNVGMCNLRAFKYEEVTNTPNAVNMSEYVKKSDLKAEVENLINSMLGGNANEQTVPTTKPNKTITQ